MVKTPQAKTCQYCGNPTDEPCCDKRIRQQIMKRLRQLKASEKR